MARRPRGWVLMGTLVVGGAVHAQARTAATAPNGTSGSDMRPNPLLSTFAAQAETTRLRLGALSSAAEEERAPCCSLASRPLPPLLPFWATRSPFARVLAERMTVWKLAFASGRAASHPVAPLERGSLGWDTRFSAPRLALTDAVGTLTGVSASRGAAPVSGRLLHVHGGAVLRLGTSF